MHPVLVFFKGGVGNVGPVSPIADFDLRIPSWHDVGAATKRIAVAGLDRYHLSLKGIFPKGRKCGFIGAFDGSNRLVATEDFGTATVVLEEKDQRVVELVGVLESLDDASYSLIHVVDHGGVDFHAGSFPFLMLDFIPVADHGGGFPMVGKQLHFFEALDPVSAGGGVATVVFALVFGDVLRQGVHGPVRSGVGDVLKEGFVRVLLGVFPDIANRVVGDGVGVVPGILGLIFRIVLRCDVAISAGEAVRIKEGSRPVDRSIEAVEAALQRPVRSVGVLQFIATIGSDMPLAGHVGAIACRFEGFRNGDAVAIQISAVTIKAVVAHHVTDSRLVRVEPCEQRGAGGAATTRIVELGESKPALSESVEMGSLNFPAIASNVGPAHVIRHDEDDVGLLWGGVGCCRDQHGEAEERA